jgi:UDP-2-acetamido-2,6-beta-L-arabino-hexul-4-ose reductase
VRILVTGSAGFIGKNLVFHLNEHKIYKVIQFTRKDDIDLLQSFVDRADAIIHLAGENRPNDEKSFDTVNTGLTESICSAIKLTGRKIPLVFASSIQAKSDNPYGNSKRNAELALEKLATDTDSPIFIYRLPNVFGKWCKPNYNSVVATFCHNIANDLPIKVNADSIELRLVYIDDVIMAFIKSLQSNSAGFDYIQIDREYSITLGALAEQIKAFKNCRNNLILENVGNGLIRALYATYISYLPTSKFSYEIPIYGDDRGAFVEILKTKNSGQFSFFTAVSGVTRGEHYHHSKTEKFIVVRGTAQFNFRNLTTNEVYKILTSDKVPEIVETIPGWAHNITNVGKEDLIVMLWANEIFNRESPDTIACKV